MAKQTKAKTTAAKVPVVEHTTPEQIAQAVAPELKMSPELAADMLRAKEASALRLEAPAVTVRGGKIAQKRLYDTYAPECVQQPGEPAPEWHPFTGDVTKHDEYIAAGYEPIVCKGRHVKGNGGDPLYRIRQELYERGLEEVAGLSRRHISESEIATESNDMLDKEQSEVQTVDQPVIPKRDDD